MICTIKPICVQKRKEKNKEIMATKSFCDYHQPVLIHAPLWKHKNTKIYIFFFFTWCLFISKLTSCNKNDSISMFSTITTTITTTVIKINYNNNKKNYL